jgi:hypothetical protein
MNKSNKKKSNLFPLKLANMLSVWCKSISPNGRLSSSFGRSIDCVPQTLHEWVRKSTRSILGCEYGITSDECDRIKNLEREVSINVYASR